MRKSDPHHCNKCGALLTDGGLCRVEHFDPSFTVRRHELIGRSHTGKLAAPVSLMDAIRQGAMDEVVDYLTTKPAGSPPGLRDIGAEMGMPPILVRTEGAA